MAIVKLHENQCAALRDVVAREGIAASAKRAGISRGSLTTAIAGLPVTSGCAMQAAALIPQNAKSAG